MLQRADFCFSAVMAEAATKENLTLDGDQLSLIADLHTLSQQILQPQVAVKGLYVWGRTGRGKSFILDHFFASLPLCEKRRVHFHHFFRELHQRLNAPSAPSLPHVVAQMTQNCRLLCFDEFHLHDPADAMLIKVLLEHLFTQNIVLLATSNYPPDRLLPNPLYHDRFLPSINLIKQHMTVAALNGDQDYRERHVSRENDFCHGKLLVQPTRHLRATLDLPEVAEHPQPLTVGYRTLHTASGNGAFLHFTFDQLCQAPTSVMDYLTLCEQHRNWLVEGVPALGAVSPAAQQRFINVVDVLYEKQCRLTLIADCVLEKVVEGVALDDIQRTYSRLLQLAREE
ncbi:cell division protein ZapE [Klebsiella aerogenes]|nr:cell division protein ZapE [Klebsiella aerogenes]